MKQGTARNRGMKVARGEYIAYVDSDDWVELNMCEEMYKTAKEYDADIVNSNSFIFQNGKDLAVTRNCTNSDIGAMNAQKLMHFMNNSSSFVSSIYKRTFLIQNDIFFPENIFFEDSYFNFMSMLYAKIIVKNDGHYYHYFQRDNSSSHRRNEESCYDRIKIAQMFLDDCKKEVLCLSMEKK